MDKKPPNGRELKPTKKSKRIVPRGLLDVLDSPSRPLAQLSFSTKTENQATAMGLCLSSPTLGSAHPGYYGQRPPSYAGKDNLLFLLWGDKRRKRSKKKNPKRLTRFPKFHH
jgi:hypothetical protein